MIACKICNSPKVENKDTLLCSTHNKLSRTPVKEKKKPVPIKKVSKPIAKHSENNTWEASDGTRYTSQEVAKNIHDAKARKKGKMMAVHGYFYCEDCGRTDCEPPFDMSHEVSVDMCKKKGMVELAWDDVNNLKLRGRKCHQRKDRLDLQWTANKS
jgi:hypothetical protein